MAEYRYVIERNQLKNKFLGNSLQRPSLLVKPMEHQFTKTKETAADKGDKIE